MSSVFVSTVGRIFTGFLDKQANLTDRTGATAVLDATHTCVADGKRLRLAFCYWGYVAAVGQLIGPSPLLRTVAPLDLLRASLLAHGDLLDGSDTRRGAPSTHHRFEALLPGPRVAHFGEAAAILLGDVLFSQSVEMFENADLSPEAVRHTASMLVTMRGEVLLSQYLDITTTFETASRSTPRTRADTVRKVLEFKSARYSVRYPAELGAILGEAPPGLLAALGTYDSLLKGAFQLRDDILGVLEDPEATGRPAGDNIREDRHTVLVLTALENSDTRQRDALDFLLGTPRLTEEDPTIAREIIETIGARNSCEELIARSTMDALTTLEGADINAEGRSVLVTLVGLTTDHGR